MANTLYEGMFILDSSRFSRDQAGVVEGVEGLIRSHGGELVVSQLYEERRLAYPINGHRKGTYWLTYFRIDGPQIAPLTKQCEISDTILRQLFLKVHPKLVDTVLAHASGAVEEPDEEEAEAPAEGVAEPAGAEA